MTPKSRISFAWLPAVAYMGLIWALSSLSSVPSLQDVPFKDKGVHFMEYGVLATLLFHAFAGTWPQLSARTGYVCTLLCTIAWGLSDEIHQAFVPGRSSDVQDVLADTIGGAFGAAAYLGLRALVRRLSAASRARSVR